MKVRTLVGVGIGLALLVALIVAAVVASGRTTERYPTGSPEATVQQYFEALIDDRPDDALAFLHDDLRDRCDRDFGPRINDLRVSRVVLDDVELGRNDSEADTARVRVRITQNWGNSIFGPDESTFTETITLTLGDDGWRITRPPWPYFDCPPLPEDEP